MALEKPLLVAAYMLMLGALMFRLCLPRVEAAIFGECVFQFGLSCWDDEAEADGWSHLWSLIDSSDAKAILIRNRQMHSMTWTPTFSSSSWEHGSVSGRF